MADVQTADLYERDFYLWLLDQAGAVRRLRDAAHRQGDIASALSAIDWDNLIEEIEGLARRDRRELQRRIRTIIEHLAKLELSPAPEPRRGWKETVQRSRNEIETLLIQSPSLCRAVPETLELPITARVAKVVVDNLVEFGEIPPTTPPPAYTEAQILEDWWPEQQATTP